MRTRGARQFAEQLMDGLRKHGGEVIVCLSFLVPVGLVALRAIVRDYTPPMIGLNIAPYWPILYILSVPAFIFASYQLDATSLDAEGNTIRDTRNASSFIIPCILMFFIVLGVGIYAEDQTFRNRPRNMLRDIQPTLKEYRAKHGHWPVHLEELFPRGPRWKRRTALLITFHGSDDATTGAYHYPTYFDDSVPIGIFYPESGEFDESGMMLP